MTTKKLIRYFRNFDDELGPWFTFAVYASNHPETDQGVCTVVSMTENAHAKTIQTNHIVLDGGADGALQKAIDHLDSIFGNGGDGYEKTMEDL